MLATALASALAIGLAGSPHCIGMCGPFAAACSRSAGAVGALQWSAGRILTYSALGATAGAVGALLGGLLAPLQYVGAALSIAMVTLAAAWMAGVIPEPAFLARTASSASRIAGRIGGPAGRVLLGMASGLLPCGLVYSAVAVAASTGNAAYGAIVLATFGVATLPVFAVAGAGVRRLLALHRPVRWAVAAAVLVAGVWTAIHRLPAAEDPDAVPDCCSGATAEAGPEPRR